MIAGWDFSGLTNGGSSPFAATTSSTATVVTGLSRAFSGAQANAGVGTWGQNALTAQTQATAISQNAFWSFSITPSVAGVSLSDIAAFNVWLNDQNASTAPPNDFFGIWQYRVNSNPFTDIGSSAQLGSVSQGAGNTQAAVSLSGIASLQSMAAGIRAKKARTGHGRQCGREVAGVGFEPTTSRL